MTLTAEDRGDFVIGSAVAGKIERPVAHLSPSRKLGDGVDPQLDLKITHGAATPDDPDQSDIVLTSVKHHFIHEAPEQRFALCIDRGWVRPNLWETHGKAGELAMQDLAYRLLINGVGGGWLKQAPPRLP